MLWPDLKIRRLLRCVNRRIDLNSLPLAIELQRALGATSARDALLNAIDTAFDVSVESERIQHDLIVRCDVMQQKIAKVAKDLNISRRGLFRLRAEAIRVLTQAINERLSASQVSDRSLVLRLASAVRRFDPQQATRLFDVASTELADHTAYDAVCNVLSAGGDVDPVLIARCTGLWEPLALLQIAHYKVIHGRLSAAQQLRTDVESSLNAELGGHLRRARFELALFDYSDAERQCDVKALREATNRMLLTAGNGLVSNGLTLVCQAEHAVEDLELQSALMRLRRLERFPTDGIGERLLPRISHVAATIRFSLLEFENVFDLSLSTATLAQNADPPLAMKAYALAGRVALVTQRQWTYPTELAERFSSGWNAALLRSVHARHLVMIDPEAALEMSKKAAKICDLQEAPAAHAYALASQAIALIALGDSRGSELLLKSWKSGIQLSSRTTLVDQVVHPMLVQREFGPFSLDGEFFASVAGHIAVRGSHEAFRSPEWLDHVMRAAISFGVSGEDEIRPSKQCADGASLGACFVEDANDASRAAFLAEIRTLAWTLSTCLPFRRRAIFEHRFLTAVCALIPALLTQASSSKIA